MTAYPLPDRFDDDESPTLRMRTLVLERPSRASRPSQESGFWPAQAPQPIDTLDPALRSMSDPNAVFATWQDEAMTSAAASMVVRAASVATPLPHAPAPAPVAARAPSPPPVGSTISPDGTLLPWREAPPTSSRGSILIALAVLLTGAGAAAVGYTRAATTGPATVAAHVARTPEHVARELVLVGAAMEKRAPAASATPARPRPRRPRVTAPPVVSSPAPAPASAAPVESPAPAAEPPSTPSGDPTE